MNSSATLPSEQDRARASSSPRTIIMMATLILPLPVFCPPLPTALASQSVDQHPAQELAARTIPAKSLLSGERSPQHVVAFHPDGGWVVASGTRSYARNIPGEAYEKLNAFTDRGKVVDAIAFTPDGGFAIVAQDAYWTRNVGGGYHTTLKALFRRNGGDAPRVRAVAFNPENWKRDRGFVIVHERGFEARNIPREMRDKLNEYERNRVPVNAVTFTPTGGWAIVTARGSWTRNVGGPRCEGGQSYYERITKLAGRVPVHAVAFNPRDYRRRKGYVILLENNFVAQDIPAELAQRLRTVFGLGGAPERTRCATVAAERPEPEAGRATIWGRVTGRTDLIVNVQLVDERENLIQRSELDANGRYRFREVPAGTYWIFVNDGKSEAWISPKGSVRITVSGSGSYQQHFQVR